MKQQLNLVRKLAQAEPLASDSRTFRFVCSTDTEDAHGDVLIQDWQLDRYKKNPVVLWNHGNGGSFFGDVSVDEYFPVGKASALKVEDGQLTADITIATAEVNPLCERIYQGLKQGVLGAVSVGFLPGDIRYEKRDGIDVAVLSHNELFEISIVPIPSNPDAVRASLKSFLSNQENISMNTTTTENKEAAANKNPLWSILGADDQDSAVAKALANQEAAGQLDLAKKKIADLESELSSSKITTMLHDAERDGKITPANKEKILSASGNDPKRLAAIIDVLPKQLDVGATPVRTETAHDASSLSAAEKQFCEFHKIDPVAYAAKKAAFSQE